MAILDMFMPSCHELLNEGRICSVLKDQISSQRHTGICSSKRIKVLPVLRIPTVKTSHQAGIDCHLSNMQIPCVHFHKELKSGERIR